MTDPSPTREVTGDGDRSRSLPTIAIPYQASACEQEPVDPALSRQSPSRAYESPAYFAARRAERRLAGLCRDCPNESHGKTQCLTCRLKRAGRAWRQTTIEGYEPLDEILASPAVRILRALRWFGWVDTGDLFIALDLPDHHENPAERQCYLDALRNLARAGCADRNGPLWRISAAGRLELGQRIARAA